MFPRSRSTRRSAATLATTLVLGAGAGAAAAAIVHDGTRTVEHVTTVPSTSTASTAAGSGMTVNEVYRAVRRGVVDITVTEASGRAEGSGFVVDARGDIVTNQHVVSGGGAIKVEFPDGTQTSARVVGADPSTDIAVIRASAPASKLQPLTFGDSGKVQVGDGVIAIGSPFGLAGSLTTGVVSALDRSITAPNRYTITGAIQTDAPINRGNSGGPLLDSHGDVIGVNSQIESSSGGSNGVGFAVASNTVRRVAQDLIAGNKVAHPYLGVQLTDASGGAGVAAVRSGSPADAAGLRRGDVITSVGGRPVETSSEAVAAIDKRKPGDTLALALRRGGREVTTSVTLAERPS